MKKFEVNVYRYPETHKIEASTKEEAMDTVINSLDDLNIEEITAEEILKDEHSCNKHFEWKQDCPDCVQKLKKVVEG